MDSKIVMTRDCGSSTGGSLHSEGPATCTAEIVGAVDPQALGRAKAPKKETLINRSAVKAYALGVAKGMRAGKFTRVGESFLIGVEAELDSKIRQLVIQQTEPPSHVGLKLTTKLSHAKAAARLEALTARIIVGKVMRHPSVGQTLKD